MICQDPGISMTKNRMEDSFNLSLPIKGVNSIYEALDKMVEGEVISDYKLDGHDKSVDI